MCVSRSKYMRREKREKNDHQKQVYVDIKARIELSVVEQKQNYIKLSQMSDLSVSFPGELSRSTWSIDDSTTVHNSVIKLATHSVRTSPRHVKHHFY